MLACCLHILCGDQVDREVFESSSPVLQTGAKLTQLPICLSGDSAGESKRFPRKLRKNLPTKKAWCSRHQAFNLFSKQTELCHLIHGPMPEPFANCFADIPLALPDLMFWFSDMICSVFVSLFVFSLI